MYIIVVLDTLYIQEPYAFFGFLSSLSKLYKIQRAVGKCKLKAFCLLFQLQLYSTMLTKTVAVVFLLCLPFAVCDGTNVVDYSDNYVDNQNLCILRHMLYSYTESDNLTLSNMVRLFDSVTTGYHDKAPPHAHGELPDMVNNKQCLVARLNIKYQYLSTVCSVFVARLNIKICFRITYIILLLLLHYSHSWYHSSHRL